eukprot:scaffold39077_cov72-Cyclotella_meneghiniana.AAC.7
MISTARHVLTAGHRHGGRTILTTALENQCFVSHVLCKTMHTEAEIDAAKTFFDAFDSSSSMRGKVVYSLSFAGDLEKDLASDNTLPVLDDIMMRQLLHSYSTHGLPSSSTARKLRSKLPPHLKLSSLVPSTLDAKESLPRLQTEVSPSLPPSGYNQPLPKHINEIDPSRLKEDPRAIVVTDIKSPYCITQVNSAWETLCGYKQEECKGKTLKFLQGPDTDWSTLSTLLTRLLAGEEASVMLTNYAKNGRRMKNLVKVGSVKDEMGKTVRFVGVLRELKDSENCISGKHNSLRQETKQLPFVA